MKRTMRAVVVTRPHEIAVTEVDVPTPAEGEVLIKVEYCGICGTDLHVAEGLYQPISYPVIVGHEFSGTVEALGAGVDGLAIGDRVVVDPSLYCGHCEYCRAGKDNLCLNGGGLGTTGPGAAAEYVAVSAKLCFPIPDDLDSATAALVEPLACVVHGFELLPRTTGAHYLVYGAGTMGLLVTAVAASSGAGSVSVVDKDPRRLPVAEKLGATATALGTADLARADRKWDVVIDCTGAIPAIEDAISRIRRGGVFLQFGVARPDATVEVNPFQLYKEEIKFLGSRAVLNNFDAALALLASGAINTEALIAETINLDGFEAALGQIAKGSTGKILVAPNS